MSSDRIVVEKLPFDGGRLVSVFLPATRATAVVFAADGAEVARWGEHLAGPGVASTAIVGVHGLPDELRRLEEYSLGFDDERFAAHEQFFVHDVRGWGRERFELDLPAARTAVFGASAGGELALALGLRHPDVYGVILSGSPGAGFQPPVPVPGSPPRVYLVAGTREPFFLENAARWSQALEEGEPSSNSRSATATTGPPSGGQSSRG